MLAVVEGIHDIEFLRRISWVLYLDNPQLPNVAELERQGELVFIPFGGGPVAAWADRLAPLEKPEFHLIDREQPPEIEFRRAVVASINQRKNCRAFLTHKRSLENYLHPAAILEVANVEVEIGDSDDVAELVSHRLFLRKGCQEAWESLSRRPRRRLANRAKRWLNTLAVDQMTLELLCERDPNDEVRGWFQAIAELAEAHSVCRR